MTRLICISTVLVLIAWSVIPESRAQQNDEDPNASKIQELLKQRRDTLQKRYDIIQRRFDDGSLSFDHVVPALDDLLKAQIEFAESRKEQIAFCKQRVENLRTLEKYAEVKSNLGTGRTEEKYAATAARIQAEIECLRFESDSD